MNILVKKEDNWVIASFDESLNLEYTPVLLVHDSYPVVFSGYDEDNSKIVEGVTIPDDYVDLKYNYDEESETWSENETYASLQSVSNEPSEHDPNPDFDRDLIED
ncbi:MAG: hypothetical protein CBD88_07950 [Flavobacteriales bacterium TMED228]|nr:MAG: hypothetical protein CBD88_07950 [Flavobacteriales bacterium TMED228]|tara:strand:- start:556 stop:870 length:315 start_codon:yes stop_codon:yes gene_type:complete